MQYISKYISRKKGHAIIRRFLKKQWSREAQCYVNLNYNELKRDKTFEKQLIREQQGFCCYCMRHLCKGEVTLEHVMPQKIKKEDLKREIKYYAQYGRLKNRYVRYMEQVPRTPRLKTPPYPHSLAYENLVASCSGKVHSEGERYVLHQCCNNFRGNQRIIPLFFVKEVGSLVEYRKDGTIDCQERMDETIKLLNLEHPSLVFIRKIWASIVNAGVSVNDIESAKQDLLLRGDIISDIDIAREERQKLKKNTYWDLLNEFYWFYGYYQKKLG